MNVNIYCVFGVIFTIFFLSSLMGGSYEDSDLYWKEIYLKKKKNIVQLQPGLRRIFFHQG